MPFSEIISMDNLALTTLAGAVALLFKHLIDSKDTAIKDAKAEREIYSNLLDEALDIIRTEVGKKDGKVEFPKVPGDVKPLQAAAELAAAKVAFEGKAGVP